ncbi:MAG: hypothetical protein FJX54_09395 [Alphaproteobacteria bacterium]|nr:hypothetical protein [Alphaproteobacteria bacterium]
MLKLVIVTASVAVASFAIAQTTPPGPPPPTVAGPKAAVPGQPSTAQAPAPAAPTQTVPGTVLTPNPANSTAEVPATPKIPPGAPVAGANSFTESQAKARIEARGFTNVSGLKKDDKSIWRGTAMKDGKSVSIALDYQGNVVAN